MRSYNAVIMRSWKLGRTIGDVSLFNIRNVREGTTLMEETIAEETLPRDNSGRDTTEETIAEKISAIE
jgi:hypothetical protein